MNIHAAMHRLSILLERKRAFLMVLLFFAVTFWWHAVVFQRRGPPQNETFSSNKSLRHEYLSKLHQTIDSSQKEERQTSHNCAPRQGLIIVNVLGRLANDLFEVAFARRLSEALCWPIVYRKFWDAELPSSRGSTCLPNAEVSSTLPDTLPQGQVFPNTTTWNGWRHEEEGDGGNEAYIDWVQAQNDSVLRLRHLKFDFTGNGVDSLVQDLYSPDSQVQVVSMEAFFIHYDWMKDWMPRIREWLSVSPDCCRHSPPEDAVVMHVRDFDPEDSGFNGIQSSAYIEILQHYYYENETSRPLWIVCQPKTRSSEFVQEVLSAMSQVPDVTIVTGIDQYDAFCTLTRAKTLILSYISSYSQMAALLNVHEDSAEVHYPVPTLEEPEVTLQVPGWHYHLLKDTLDGVEEWDVGYERIKPLMA